MSSVFAVCDVETDYAIRFMEFLNRRNLPFEVQMFTSVPPLCEYAKQKHIELLLISERALCDEVRNLKVGKMILLSEGNHIHTEPELPAVYKYQSSAQVVREVLDCYSAERVAAQAAADIRKNQGKMYGVYGLFDPMRQMLFSLTFGQILAETQTVLYINLQKHSGLMNLTEESGEETELTLSDLLFFYRQKKRGMLYRLPGMIRQIGRLDYIPVPFFSEDLGELSGEEWSGFLEELRNIDSHDVLLLDLSDGLRGIPDILTCCTDLYFLSEEDPFSMRKRQLVEKELEEADSVRPRWFSPPLPEEIGEGRWFLESLPGSNIGEYIRRVIRPDIG